MDCPNCSQPGARRRWFRIRCPNPACPSYDESMTARGASGFAARPAAPPMASDGGAASDVGPPSSSGPGTDESRRIRAQIGPGASWILWIVAYGLFRFGQHHEKFRIVLWAIAAAVALTAYTLGRRAAAAPVPEGADDDEDIELEELEDDDEADSAEPFDPTGARRIGIRYRDRLDREREFVADRMSLRRRGAHVTARVEPGGARIAFRADRILNRADVEGAFPT